MAKKIKSSLVDYELETGEVVKLSLTYLALFKIRQAFPEIYKQYNEITIKGAKEELDMATLIYTGYLGGIVVQGGDIEEAYSYEEFLSMMSPDREYIKEAMMKLMNPKKATASDGLS